MAAAPIGRDIVEPRLAAWAYLSKVVQGPCQALTALIEMVGVEEAARAVRDWDLPHALRARTQARRHLDTAAADLRLMERLGGRLVTPDDPQWPAWRLLSFAQLDPTGNSDGVEPVALWVLGTAEPAALVERAVAVVGTRAVSPYGERVTTDIVTELADAGVTIVSGAAYGVDAAAHRAALGAGGPTVAVVATGVDRPYPAGHTRLLRQIAESGLVISEYAPGTTAAKHRFLVRNRLVAALADAVVVIEAGRRSGARSTAAWARKLGRPALAVPGSVLSATSVGCHRMIRDGEAVLIADAREVLEVVAPHHAALSGSGDEVTRLTDGLSATELAVYDALPGSGSRTPAELAESAAVALSDVRAALPVLELRGVAVTDETGGADGPDATDNKGVIGFTAEKVDLIRPVNPIFQEAGRIENQAYRTGTEKLSKSGVTHALI